MDDHQCRWYAFRGAVAALVVTGGVPVAAGAQRQAILAGQRVGPRIISAGPLIEVAPTNGYLFAGGGGLAYMTALGLLRKEERPGLDSLARAQGGWEQPRAQAMLDSFLLANGRIAPVVERLQAEGADFIKLRDMSPAMYYAFAAVARHQGIPFGGHAADKGAIAVSDSGASIIDHYQVGDEGLLARCVVKGIGASVERCRPIAERFRRNGTWWIPTFAVYIGMGSKRLPFRCKHSRDVPATCGPDSLGLLTIAHQTGLPIMAGTDAGPDSLPWELAVSVLEGLTPLEALRSATLNPAKYLRGTDSLGTVSRGKLADLVLLDADPLTDITNVTRIRAVVANGRYFDRATLDSLSKR